jgi:RNAse (barnase) inhibitor barstar
MPYIWNTQTLLILIGLQMRLINSNNHGILQSKIHQKTLFYRCFKETFEFEKKYLEILDHKYLFDFFKLRTSNQKFPIECGRWQNIKRNRRLWKLCQNQEIGDEFHYIMECPFFKYKRKLFIKQKYIQNPNMKQLNNLVTSKNRKELTNICKLIKEIDNGGCASG